MPHPVSPEASEDVELPDAPPISKQEAAPDEWGSDLEDDIDPIQTDPKESNLDNMFDDMDDDEDLDLLTSQPEGTMPASSPPVPPGPEAFKVQYTDPELTKAYYQRLFPFQTLYQWLNHGITPSNDFAHREFAFTIRTPEGKEVYIRYLSYLTGDLLRKDVVAQNPLRFEIGPVYSTNPREKKGLRPGAFRPLAKEICFDLDITDYIDIRRCCGKTDKNICRKCWRWAVMALKVIDAALRDDFGFKHILWVYSGRRGIHAWVCDKQVRNLDDSRRRAITGYLELVKGGTQSGKRVNVKRPLHLHLARSLEILKEHFLGDILTDQDPWQDEDKTERLLDLLPDKSLKEALRKKWNSAPGRSSRTKWNDIDSVAKTGAIKSLDSKSLLEAKQDIVLEYTYARIDAEVGKKLNHLLKSPFVIHPGTGRVCVPIDPRKLDDFDPLAAPIITDLLEEIDRWDKDHPAEEQGEGAKRTKDYEKTSLKPYVDYFKSFVAALLKAEGPVKLGKDNGGADSMEF
ncbi:MAG: hypothetical protein M1814_004487 [Vezdaea aestivalis]|nr:MAG: hypothetical protein M1814_004487 [Vezdaea aestivalis]